MWSSGWPVFLGGVAVVCLLGCGGAAQDERGAEGPAIVPAADSATVPVTLDHNRVIVEISLGRPDGSLRRAAAWVDTGNQFLIVGELLAGELGIDRSGLEEGSSGHSVESASPAPAVQIGDLVLDMEGIGVRVRSGDQVMPGIPAEVCLPAAALRRLHVVFDYPARRMTVALPGVLTARGEPVACRVNPETGLFLVEAVIEGEAVQLGIDTGSAGTWVSTALTSNWLERHPQRPRAVGAVGSANFFGFPFETDGVLTLLPEIEIGGQQIRDVAVLGLDQGLFDWYSQKSAAPVAGFIGANVLSRCRLEIDFANRMTYWEVGPAPADRDLDIVGLTLRPEADGNFVVAGVTARDGAAVVDGVEVGDGLIRVDQLDTAGATMGAVVAALRGAPGEERTLLVERDGVRFSVEARVTAFP